MINGERIRQAREYRGLTQVELAELIGLDQSAVAHLESGRFQVSRSALETIALRTGFPIAFFSQETAPDFPLGTLQYRSHAALTRAEKRLSYRHAELGHEIAYWLLARMKPVPVMIGRLNTDPANAARLTRSAMRLASDRPIPSVVNALEKAGVLVLALAPIVSHIEAFSTWAGTDSPRPVLVMIAGKPGDRERMSAGHDLGHLVLPARGDQKQTEREAFQFAAEFLMPAEAMLAELTPPVTLTRLAELKARWGVSIQALIRRAKDLNIISDRQYRYLFEQLGMQGWRTTEPVYIPSERPRGVRRMAELLYGTPIDIKKFADDVRVTPQVINEMLSLYAAGAETLSPPKPPGGSGTLRSLRAVAPTDASRLPGNVRPFPRR